MLDQHLSLDFLEVTQAHLNQYIHEGTEEEYKEEEKEKTNQRIHEIAWHWELFELTKSQTKLTELKKTVNTPGQFSLTPLHIVAIMGNARGIIRLKEMGAKFNSKAASGITVLELAIKHCELQGNNLPLIEQFSNPEWIVEKTSKNISPILMALFTLETPLPVVRFLAKKGGFPLKLHSFLFEIAKNVYG